MHPSEEIFCEKGTRLKGKKIVLGITGSIAAVDTFHLIRELIRNGADITPVMSQAAVQLVAPDAIEFATGKKPILSITGQTEHIKYFAEGSDTDLFLIHPITANTISKIANGIDDTAVTTMATVVMGSDIPMMIVPAMHGRMFSNPAVARNLKALEDAGVYVIGPHMEE
ncbi:MAG: bifunctional phosphopantothenoylcysteine decarboxylase/phosphopantothenate--cysteine ligase CoaBC, partial [archaeon]|nr:bifunctional phosphopantothenoylcysteine decarboxylase/phosphopantothenate--cysteine ligase CoaBC [archaeon]